MSKFFTAMQQAARQSGSTPSISIPDVVGLASTTPDTPEVQTVEENPVEAPNYRRVTPRPLSSTVLPPLDGPYLRVAEQYRIIRTKIVQHPAKHRLLTVSSAGISDGKTISSINIAGALALKVARVYLERD